MEQANEQGRCRDVASRTNSRLSRPDGAAGARVVRAVAGLLAGVAAVAAWLLYEDVRTAGFPDGHLTAYDEASRLPLTICAWGNLAAAAWFAYLGGLAPGARLKQRTLLSAVLYAGVMAAALYAIPYYFIDHLGLEHGQGG